MEVDRRGAPESNLEGAPDGKTSFSVPLNQSGYFQFLGVSPGKHLLTVECPEASAVRELLVQANLPTRVDPLPLEELTLEIAVTPKLDPVGKPWQLTVDATMPRLRQIAVKATTSADGRWARHGLTTGNYRVAINRSDGTPWLQKFFNLSAKSGPLQLKLPFMRVEGEVRLSTQPVRARLVFFNEAGGEPTTLNSDDNGFFQGLLPVTPDAQKTVWTVEARAAHPPISRRLTGISVLSAGETHAWLDLTLPIFAVHGTAVSENGQLQSGVAVTFEDTSSGARTSTATDDAGGFEFDDLPPGKYTAVAESIDGTSDRTPFETVDGVEEELKLVLNPSERVPFYVVSSQGPVTDASVQVWIPPGVPWYFTRTDSDGRFEAKLPPRTAEIGLTIRAPGYPLKLTRLPIPSDSDKSSDENDTNTITIDASGGTLTLDLQPPGRVLDTSATPYLVHDGAIEAAGTLVDWSTKQAYIGGGGPGVVESIEPGDYALCFLADPEQLAALWSGAMPSERCRKGSIKDGGTLTLSPP
jgi:hypothetical protein